MLKRYLHFHWQNLNERRDGSNGPAWRHGRCWLSRGAWAFRLEWCAKDVRKFGFRFELGDEEDDLHLSLHFGASLYVGLCAPVLRRMNARIPGGEAECTLFLEDGGRVHWSAWSRPWEMRSADPWWRRTHIIELQDVLFGRPTYSSKEIEAREVLVPMPEGSYAGTAKLTVDEWKRPRWPWPRRVTRVKIDLPHGIPHEGKGENSWDCGEDATYGITTAANTIEEAVGNLVASSLRSRKRYGGKHLHRDLAAVMAPTKPKTEAA